MTKAEFLKELKDYLEENLPGADIEGTLAFYSEYFDRQTKQGRTEEEAAAELGDPGLIGKSIVAADQHKETGRSRANADEAHRKQADGTEGFRKSGKRLLLEIAGAVVGCIVFFVILRFVFFLIGPLLPFMLIAGAAVLFAQARRRK